MKIDPEVDKSLSMQRRRKSECPKMENKFGDYPKKLSCGCAFGDAIRIGQTGVQDYVGSCINMASRLQKYDKFSFAFYLAGYSLDECFSGKYADMFVPIRGSVRGNLGNDIIHVSKEEFES